MVDGVKPNRAHLRLAQLEREGKLKAVITQNIDGCIRRREAKTCWSFTAAYCVRTACRRQYDAGVINKGILRACRAVPAAAS